MFQPSSRRGKRPASPDATPLRNSVRKSGTAEQGVPRYLGGQGPAEGVGVPRYLGGRGPAVQHKPEAGKKDTAAGIPLFLRQAAGVGAGGMGGGAAASTGAGGASAGALLDSLAHVPASSALAAYAQASQASACWR